MLGKSLFSLCIEAHAEESHNISFVCAYNGFLYMQISGQYVTFWSRRHSGGKGRPAVMIACRPSDHSD